MCFILETFKYHQRYLAVLSNLPASKATWNSPQTIAPALYCRRTRSIETFTQTVTEFWVGNCVSKVVVTDTTEQLQANQEFNSVHSMHEPFARELTTSLTQVLREYPYWPLSISGPGPKAQNYIASQRAHDADLYPLCSYA